MVNNGITSLPKYSKELKSQYIGNGEYSNS